MVLKHPVNSVGALDQAVDITLCIFDITLCIFACLIEGGGGQKLVLLFMPRLC